jgi:competence protein ComEC
MGGTGAHTGWHIGLALAAWAGGVGLQLRRAHTLEPASAAVVLALAVLVALLAVFRGRIGRLPAAAVAAVLLPSLALAGFALTDMRAGQRLAERLPPALEGRDLVVTGVVAELPRVSASGVMFAFEVESARLEGRPVAVPPLLSLGWFQGFDGEQLIASPVQALVAGDRWQLPVRLKRPHGARNPHGFDLELWLFERGFGASGTVRPGAVRLAEAAGAPVQRLRQAVRDAILLRVADPAAAGVLAALAVGDQAAIEREEWDVFRITGVAHLMSISGLHVTMFAWLAGGAVGWAWRRSPGLVLRVPAPVAARWGGLLGALAYSVVAGWGVPAQRTVMMVAAVVVLRSLGVRWPQLLVLGCAGAAVTLLDPWALLQPGFWLSFVAVGVLVVSDPAGRAPAAPGWRGRLAEAARAQAVATVGLAPLSMVFFQQISVVGFLANALAIPLVTLVVTPLALLGVLLPVLWVPAAWCVQGLLAGLAPLAALPLAQWTAAAAPAWAVVPGLLGGALVVMPLPLRLRLLALPLVLPLVAPVPARPPAGTFEVVAADIGQGTAVLVRTRTRLLVYDTGPRTSAASDAGQRVLLPLLGARGERRVDLLVLSHQDTDHIGGAESLLRGLPVRAATSSLPESHPLHARLPAHEPCQAGQAWSWDGVRFEVLHPLPRTGEEPARAVRANALSCVLRVADATGRALLLAGDLEAPQERALVAQDAQALRAQVLQVPHHGSRTSSTPGFLEAVAPEVALVQAGYRNRYGHPARDVVARYEARGIALVRSDRCGAWAWRSSAPAGEGRCQRRAEERYWHHRP